jgi:hypothetical protein
LATPVCSKKKINREKNCNGMELVGGEGPEDLGGEVFSMRQDTTVRHGKK